MSPSAPAASDDVDGPLLNRRAAPRCPAPVSRQLRAPRVSRIFVSAITNTFSVSYASSPRWLARCNSGMSPTIHRPRGAHEVPRRRTSSPPGGDFRLWHAPVRGGQGADDAKGFRQGRSLPARRRGRRPALPIAYAGQKACADCHADIVQTRALARHKAIACESSHGPLAKHADGTDETKPVRPDGKTLCARCHAAKTGKPKRYPTVDIKEHAGDENCLTCHKPHDPRIG